MTITTTMTVVSPLSSPPPASRSSSIRSAIGCDNGVDAVADATANLEDITLRNEDDAEDAVDVLASSKAHSCSSTNTTPTGSMPVGPPRYKGTVSQHRPSASTGVSRVGRMAALAAAESRRPSPPTLKEQLTGGLTVNKRFRGPPQADGRLPRKRIVSPSTSSWLAVSAGGPSQIRSLSPSPTRSIRPSELSRRSSSTLQVHPTGRQSSDPIAVTRSIRRVSWQSSRKTVEELEAEYHDSDDDVPDDAIFWNVPISPRPLEDRVNPSAVTTRSTSAERPSRLTSGRLGPRIAKVSHLSRSASVSLAPPTSSPSSSSPSSSSSSHARAVSQGGRRWAPSPPGIPHLPRASTMPTIRSQASPHQARNSRTITWNVALSELSEETKDLTEALEAHADLKQKQQRHQVEEVQREQRQRVGSRSTVMRQSSSGGMIELPPVQKGSVMVDPLPVSKEKEAVLSRTRPSWLPPKNQKEEKKHIEEYRRMMMRSRETGMCHNSGRKCSLSKKFMLTVVTFVVVVGEGGIKSARGFKSTNGVDRFETRLEYPSYVSGTNTSYPIGISSFTNHASGNYGGVGSRREVED